MPSAHFIVPGAIDGGTGGTVYDRRMVVGLRQAGWAIAVHELGGAFPDSADDARAQAEATFAACPAQALVVVDGLVVGALADVVERHAARLRLVPLVHLPLASDPTLSAGDRAARATAESRALDCASLIVATGENTRTILEGYGIARDRISVVEPGTDRAAVARGSRDGRVHLVCVATVNAIKGHDVLIRSLHRLRTSSWRLSCAGSLVRDRRTVASIERLIIKTRLTDRVTLLGELGRSQLDELLNGSDVFVLATRFETYGMAVAEALARGLPVVATRTGAIPALVGGDGAGLLVPPDDEAALTEALGGVIGDDTIRTRLRRGACQARLRLAPWSTAVQKFAEALGGVVSGE